MSDSRIETLLEALLNGTDPPQEPMSRVEAYLYALAKKGLSAGGNSTQSDWNQNDASAPDYIKNRLAYSEPVETIHVVDNLDVEFEDYDSYYCWYTEFESDIINYDDSYRIDITFVLDDIEYVDTIILKQSTYPIAGNKSIFLGNDNADADDRPWCINLMEDINQMYVYVGIHKELGISHNIDLKMLVHKIYTIPQQYLNTFSAYNASDLSIIPFLMFSSHEYAGINEVCYRNDGFLYVRLSEEVLGSKPTILHHVDDININSLLNGEINQQIDIRPDSKSITSTFKDLINGRFYKVDDINYKIIINVDDKKVSIPAQMTRYENEMFSLSATYIDDLNRYYRIDIIQIGQFNDENFCEIKEYITRLT